MGRPADHPPPARARAGGGAGAPDRGATSLELALLTPILLLVMLMVVQFAMVYHARHVALAAAQGGARVARSEVTGDWKGRSEQKARSQVQQFGSRLLANTKAEAGGDGNERWVEVSGEAVQVIPFFTFRVHQRSGGPIECFRPDVGSATRCGDGP
ncbi:TadE/TadG family type IV pilus assembly protein [Actinomadura sp. HBU206391]|uniref:TadE/TadG family type IV pilus assembly protein n=1 Tax=Actinomadura sp. HBU206391 TaxID=2731692 RepID=UPI00164FFE49|nr:TadE/TadG family type IV pilus assembly protein [Actinomadura sp. HBU206391]MBC6458671.1 pilus assembly protein [Actinomadura sp. HBU206391]